MERRYKSRYAAEPMTKREEILQTETNVFLQNYHAADLRASLPPLSKGFVKCDFIVDELERLQTEKRELLESGLYTENDEVVKVLSVQIAEAQRRPQDV